MKINVNLIDINFFEDFKNKIRSLSKHLIYFVFDRIAKYYRDILLFFFFIEPHYKWRWGCQPHSIRNYDGWETLGPRKNC